MSSGLWALWPLVFGPGKVPSGIIPADLAGWAFIFLAVIGTYLARLATFAAIPGIGTGQVALLAPSETILTVSWSILFLSERLTPLQGLGSGLILVSGLLAIQRLRRAKPRTSWRFG